MQDCSGFSALARHLRHPQDGGKYKEGKNLQEEAEAYDKALIAAAAQGGFRFSKSTYVRPHLLRKHLILLKSKCNGMFRKAQRLSLPQLLALNLPDEQGHLPRAFFILFLLLGTGRPAKARCSRAHLHRRFIELPSNRRGSTSIQAGESFQSKFGTAVPAASWGLRPAERAADSQLRNRGGAGSRSKTTG